MGPALCRSAERGTAAASAVGGLHDAWPGDDAESLKWQLPILTVADRSGARHFQLLPNRKNRTLQEALQPLVPGDAVLCSDGAKGYAKLAKRSQLEHFVLGSKPGTRVADCYHIQNVNSLHARYKQFIKPFCGPATKSLSGYILWLEARRAGLQPVEVIRAS